MAVKESRFVTLRGFPVRECQTEAPLVTYNTLGKAVESLNDLGLCRNFAMLTAANDYQLVTLLYQGRTYRRSMERFVTMPFNVDAPAFEQRFEELLRKIFKPFVDFNDNIQRSLIEVVPGQDWNGPECFFVTLVLHFTNEREREGKTLKIIQEVLTKAEDGHDDVSGRVFWLD